MKLICVLVIIPACRYIVYCLFLSVFCLSVCRTVLRILVTDISGVGFLRAMKFCRVVDLGFHQVISPFGPKSEKPIMHWTAVSQVRQTGRAVARHV